MKYGSVRINEDGVRSEILTQSDDLQEIWNYVSGNRNLEVVEINGYGEGDHRPVGAGSMHGMGYGYYSGMFSSDVNYSLPGSWRNGDPLR